MVTPYRQTAIATMYSLRQRFLLQGVTLRAFLTRVLRVYLDYLPGSIFSFVCKHMEEGRPSHIVNRFGEDSRRQTFDVQVFDGNHAEVLHKPIRWLVLKVFALTGNVLVRFLQQQDCLAATF